MQGEVKLPYGLTQDGRMVGIADVKRGLACACVCPQCNRRLVAKKGSRKAHHFAHEGDQNCVGALETMAHFLAKQVIADAGWVMTPPFAARHYAAWRLIESERRLDFDSVTLEVWQQGFRPDLIAEHAGTKIVIEVLVSHACTPEKLALLAERGIPALEIDLSDFRHGIADKDWFTAAVLSEAPRTWLFHPRQAAANARLADDLARDIREREAEALAAQVRADIARYEAEANAQAEAAFAEAQAERAAAEQQARWDAQEAEWRLRTAEMAKQAKAAQIAEVERKQREAHARYRSERKTYEGEAAIWLGTEAGAHWATEARYLDMLLKPIRDWSGEELDWRQCLNIEAEKLRKAREIAADFIAKLTDQATRHFRSHERAGVWLRSTNPKLGRRRPADLCTNAESYLECVGALR